jgi:DNA-binding NtrC family response regulator
MRPQHVLVLDRDLLRQQQTTATLRAAGHHVIATADPTEVAEALRAPGFDLLVLELERPTLDRAGLAAALAPATPAAPEPLEAIERRHIALVLRHTGGNKRQAAQLLGISRSTLLNKIRRYRLEEAGGREAGGER